MKNLFDYATKELSHDAFLSWLFDNFDDAEIGNASVALLKKFCSLGKHENIREVIVTRQWKKIDIFVKIKTDKDEYNLLLEDKTFSNEHNQLEGYNEVIQKEKMANCTKIFYKVGWVEDDERARVAQMGWEMIDIVWLEQFFKQYQNSNNMILKFYVEFIQKIAKANKNKKMPLSNDNWLNWIEWLAFFRNYLIPKLQTKFPGKLDFQFGKATGYPYVYLSTRPAGEKGYPDFDIWSRDCEGGRFKGKVLCYNLSDKLKGSMDKLSDILEKQGCFICRMRKNEPKQIGFTKQHSGITNEAEFVEVMANYLEKYLKYIDELQNNHLSP